MNIHENDITISWLLSEAVELHYVTSAIHSCSNLVFLSSHCSWWRSMSIMISVAVFLVS
jgi:hypothetical protein